MSKKYFLIIIVVLILISAIILRIKGKIEDQNSLSKIEKSTISSVAIIADEAEEDLPPADLENFLLEGQEFGSDEVISNELVLEDEEEERTNVLIISPQNNQIVTSPLLVKGQVTGAWFFEASLPIKLLDSQKKIIAESYALAQSDWMTTELVEFSGVLEFKNEEITDENGYVIIAKDNPSALPENEVAIQLPVRFR